MILEELIARLGFKVEGLSQVKAATTALNPLKSGLKSTASATAVAAGGAGKLKTAMGGLASVLLVAGRALRGFLMGLAKMVGTAALVVGGLGAVAAMAIKLGLAFARARGEAAQLRRETAAMAGQQRTTPDAQNAFDGAIRLQGFNEKFAKKIRESLFEKISEAADAAIRGEQDGKDKLKKLGIKSAMDPNGNQLDTGSLSLSALANLLKRQSENDKLLQKEKTLPDGKERKKAIDDKNKGQISLRNDLKELDLGKEFDGLVRELSKAGIGIDQFVASLEKAASLNPGENEAQSERTKRIATRWAEIELASAGLGEALGRLKDLIVDQFIGPLSNVMQGIVNLGKKIGLINETKKEEQDRLTKETAGNRQQHMHGERAAIDKMSPKELGAYLLAQTVRQKEAVLQNRKKEIGDNPNQAQKRWMADSESSIAGDKAELRKMIESLGTLSEAMKNIQKEISPERNIDRTLRDKKAEATKNEDNRQYSDIGNDQRTISNTVTVHASGLDGIANAVKTALNASNLIKATTASSSAITAS